MQICFTHSICFEVYDYDLFLFFSLQKEVQDYTKKDAELKIKAAIGFRHVIDLLSSEQKLIVGHNCFLGMVY